MNKKIYETPETEIVEVVTEQFFAQSNGYIEVPGEGEEEF